MEEDLTGEAEHAREVIREPDATEAAQVEVVRASERGEGLRVVRQVRDEAREHDVQRYGDVTAREEARGEPARLGDKVPQHNCTTTAVNGELRDTRAVCACTTWRAEAREGSLLHEVASVLRPDSCTADDSGREGAAAGGAAADI